jgi:hypothetical protein
MDKFDAAIPFVGEVDGYHGPKSALTEADRSPRAARQSG